MEPCPPAPAAHRRRAAQPPELGAVDGPPESGGKRGRGAHAGSPASAQRGGGGSREGEPLTAARRRAWERRRHRLRAERMLACRAMPCGLWCMPVCPKAGPLPSAVMGRCGWPMLPAGVWPSPKTKKGPPLRASSSTLRSRASSSTSAARRHCRSGGGGVGGGSHPRVHGSEPCRPRSPPCHLAPVRAASLTASSLPARSLSPRGRDAAAARADCGLGRRNHLCADPKGSSIVISDKHPVYFGSSGFLSFEFLICFRQC